MGVQPDQLLCRAPRGMGPHPELSHWHSLAGPQGATPGPGVSGWRPTPTKSLPSGDYHWKSRGTEHRLSSRSGPVAWYASEPRSGTKVTGLWVQRCQTTRKDCPSFKHAWSSDIRVLFDHPTGRTLRGMYPDDESHRAHRLQVPRAPRLGRGCRGGKLP